MKTRSFGARQGPVSDFLDQDVAKGKTVAFGGTDEIAVDEVLAQRGDVRRLAVLQRRHARGAERATEDAAELQHAPFIRR